MRCVVVVTLLLAAASSDWARGAPLFNPARLVPELSSRRSDHLGTFTADGLTLIFESRRNGYDNRLWQATRSTLSSPFSTPWDVSLVGGSPVVSADGLSIFFSRWTGRREVIFQARRANINRPFGRARIVRSLNLGVYMRPSWLSQDGLRLYMHIYSAGRWNLFMAERASLRSPFRRPRSTAFAAINGPFDDGEAVLTPDERQIFFTSNRPGGKGGGDIWWSSRPDRSAPFGRPVNVATVNSAQNDRLPLFYGNELFFSSGRGNPGSNYNGDDIFVATLITGQVPEPSSIAIVVVLAVTLCSLRYRCHRTKRL